MANQLEIRLFGGLRLAQDGMPLTAFMSNKVPALLAYLAATGRAQRRDDLAALLWGEMPDADARNNLRQAIANLRRSLEPHLIVTRDTVELNPEAPCTLDVAAFETLLDLAPGLAPEARIERLQEAAALYVGDFLAGFFVRDAPAFEEWMLAQRARFRELALHALHTLTQRHLDASQYDRAISDATRLLVFDPWREEAHRQLMLTLARTGQRSAALAQYKRCRRLLQEELDVEPSDETTALYERIKASMRGPRHNLPTVATDFVGRAGEQAELRRLLASPHTRLLTLLGPGGVGKTRLALEVAVALEPRFLHGAWFVPLAEVHSPRRDALPLAIAEALRVPLAGGDPCKQLIAYLRQRELLLVLDNLEHLIEPAGCLSDLLREAPDVKILATSRERLHLQAERVIELAGLLLPAASAASPEPGDAVQLFVRRGQCAQSDFAITPQNAADIVCICQLVQGLPLGIELAAAWVHLLSPQQIAAEIAANLDFLTSQHRDATPRQRSLRAAFDHSWKLLSADECALFCRLAVFRGSFDREAAVAVAGAALPALASLADKSLLRSQDSRYDLHEVLRQYATERLDQSGQLAEVQDRHAAYYAGLLQLQGQRLDTSHQREAIEAIATDIDNVRAAWKHAVRARRMADLTTSLTPLFRYFDVRNGQLEGRDALAAAVAALSADAKPVTGGSSLVCRLLARQGALDNRLGRYPEALAALQQALALAQSQDDPAEIVFCQMHLSYTLYALGKLAEAQQELQKATALARSLDEPLLLADVVGSLAAATAARGDYAEARRLHQESLVIMRRYDDRQSMITALSNLGTVAHWLGDYDEARRLYEESNAIARELDDRRSLAIGLHNQADIALRLGDYAASERLTREGLTLFEETGVQLGVAHSRLHLARTSAAQHHARARQQFREALQLTLHMQAVSLAVEVIVEMAPCLAQSGQGGLAVEALAFAVQHPALFDEPRARARAMLAEAAARLSPAEAGAAIAKGQSASLDDLAAKVLAA